MPPEDHPAEEPQRRPNTPWNRRDERRCCLLLLAAVLAVLGIAAVVLAIFWDACTFINSNF